MTSAGREPRYRGGQAVRGSLAYDLDWAVRERELRHAGELPRKKNQAKAAPKVHAAPRVQVRERQYVSVMAVLGVAVVAALAVLVLLHYVQLTLLAADTAALRKELAALETENVVLTAQYEQMFDMASVKEAAEAAGMRKPSSGQLYHLDMSGGDRAMAYDKEEPGLLRRLLAALNHGVYAVVEYFD